MSSPSVLRPCRSRAPFPLRRSLLCVTSLLAVAMPAGAQRAMLERITHHDTLPNGMAVIVVENHAVPLAAVEIVVRAGAMIQTVEDQGVPHLYEHMLFRGYAGPRAESFRATAAELQAAYNGTTSDETVSYYLILPSTNVSGAVDALARLVREPRFEKSDLMRERFVVLGEADRRKSDPQFILHQSVQRLLWGDGFPRKNTIGDEMSIVGVTPEHLSEIFKRYYVPNNAALVVSGDVNAPDVFSMARRAFSGWRRRDDPFVATPVQPMPALPKSRAVAVVGDVTDVTVQMTWQGPGVRARPQSTYAADVLADLLNDEQSGFQHRLVDSGLFQSIAIVYETVANTGPISVHAVTTPKRLAGALTGLDRELKAMATAGYFTNAELEAAKKRRAVASVLRQENGLGIAHGVGELWSVAGLDYHLGYVDHLSSTSLDDVRQFVSEYLDGKPFVIGALTSNDARTDVAGTLGAFLTFVSEQ